MIFRNFGDKLQLNARLEGFISTGLKTLKWKLAKPELCKRVLKVYLVNYKESSFKFKTPKLLYNITLHKCASFHFFFWKHP